MNRYVSAICLFFAALVSPAQAKVTSSELVAAGMPPDLVEFALAVSASEGNWTSLNQYSCAGAFQFCPATRRRYYEGTLEEFLASPKAQVSAYRRYMADEWRLAQSNDFDDLIGKEVCFKNKCAIITQSSIIKGCQFGCAYGGALGRYHRTGDCSKAVDGNGVSVCTYLIRGAGYNVSSVTGSVDPGATPSGGAGTCFDRDLMGGTVVVTSPFGVDRTGRSSSGYHLGLDLASSNGRGTAVYAGVPGKVVMSVSNSTNAVFVETPDGRQRVGYLHGDARRVSTGDNILSDTVVITQGDAGSKGAIHLHLEVHIAGEVVASLGESVGRVWPLKNRQTFFGSKASSGLSGASLGDAAPAPFYVVNPETYLYSRLKFRESLLSVEQYKKQGFSRPDGLTLEPTCAPTTAWLGGGMRSTNGGLNSSGGVTDFAAALIGNSQTLANVAASDARDALIQYGQAAIGSAKLSGTDYQARRAQLSSLVGLILTTEESW